MPRDPARIDVTLEEIGAFWKKYPDLRLGQLILNMHRFTDKSAPLFSVEDHVMIIGLREMERRLTTGDI
jgi:hypothetical protein